MRRTISSAAVVALLALVANHACAATLFSTDFSSSTLDSNLADLTGRTLITDPSNFIIASGSIHIDGTNPNGNGNGRAYITTVDSDYLNYTYTLQYTNQDTSLSFIGIGAGLNTGGFNEPAGGSVNFRFHSPSLSGVTNIAFNGGVIATLDPIMTVGTHTAQITRTGNLVTFSIDNLPGDTFTLDLSLPANSAINAAIGAGSKLFFGGAQDFVTFDNFSVTAVPEPNSLVFVSGSTLAMLFMANRRRRAARA